MRVIIVEDEPITRMDVRGILEDSGIEVLGEGKDGIDAINLCKLHKPDVVIMDINMPNLDGLNAAKIINKDKLAKAVLLLTAYSNEDYINKAKDSGVFGYLIKPLNEKSLIPMLEITLSRALESEEVEKKLDTVTQKLEERKCIEKAKGYLMEKENLSEKEAYKKIRSLSMEKGCTMNIICEIILLNQK